MLHRMHILVCVNKKRYGFFFPFSSSHNLCLSVSAPVWRSERINRVFRETDRVNKAAAAAAAAADVLTHDRRIDGTYACTAPAGRCCSCGCCRFWCGLWSGDQKSPRTPPWIEDTRYRWCFPYGHKMYYTSIIWALRVPGWHFIHSLIANCGVYLWKGAGQINECAKW